MLAAVARTLRRHQHGLDAGGLHQQLLLAATLQRDEPEGGRLDAVAAGGQQAVVLVDGGFHAFEPVAHGHAGALFHRYLARLVLDDHMVFKEGGGVLRDRLQRAAQGGKRGAVDRVGVAHGDDVRVRLVDGGVQHKTCAVDGVAAFHHAAFVVGQDQVGHLDLREMHAHRIGPVQLGVLRVAHRQMASKTIVKVVQGKRAASGH
jgi:hypothetical protein